MKQIFSSLFTKKEKPINKRSADVNINYISNRQNKYVSVKNPNLALTNSVIYRGISILTDSVASIPLDIYRKNKNGYWATDDKSTLHNILTRTSNKRQTIYELLEGCVMQLLLYGNTYIFINRNSNTDIKELILLYPNTVYHDVINNKYNVTDEYNHIKGLFNSNQIIHLKHKSLETIVGKSVIDYCSKTLGLASACDSESLSTLSNGGRLKGIISSESSVIGFGDAQDNQLVDIKQNMVDEINNGGDIITMPSGVKWQTISQTTKDSMILDNKQYTLSDLARFMGVSLSKLGVSMGGNYQAAQQDQLNFYIDTLNPILTKIEKAFNCYLISDSVSNKYKIEFDRSTLPYFNDIMKNYKSQLELGVLSVNDIRKIFNKEQIENGDEVVISTNLQYINSPKVEADKLIDSEEIQTQPIDN